MNHNNGNYSLNGIKAGTVIGYIGNTGAYSTNAHAHMSLNGSGNEFANLFNNSSVYNYNSYFRPDAYAQYMSGYQLHSFYNNSSLWSNVQIYSNLKPNLFNYNDFIKHNSDAYIANFWTKYR